MGSVTEPVLPRPVPDGSLALHRVERESPAAWFPAKISHLAIFASSTLGTPEWEKTWPRAKRS
jgi:hypothetical protein